MSKGSLQGSLQRSQGSDSPIVYALTPETPFSPTVSTQFTSDVYKIGTVLPKSESRHVEYKTGGGNYPTSILPSHIRKYGSAFLNSSGGILYIGVTDEGVISGIRLSRYSQKEDIKARVKAEFERFTPRVTEDLYEVKFIQCNRWNLYVLQISVRSGDPMEIYADGENKMYYRRDGSVEGPLWPCKIREIVQSKISKEFSKEVENN